jgi:hypothetical protein
MSRLERDVETEIRVAVMTTFARAWCQKHRIEPCPYCGGRPKKGQGLGIGAADLFLVMPPFGRLVCIEVKRPKLGRVAAEQRQWGAAIQKSGAIYGIATSPEEGVELARKGTVLPP